MPRQIYFFVKYCSEEQHAEDFLNGDLYFKRLSYFKGIEEEEDGRGDKHEAVAAWLQPKGLEFKISYRNHENELITHDIPDGDIAAPVSISYNYHDRFHVLCLYSIYVEEFEDTYNDSQAEEKFNQLNKEVLIDKKCENFGKYAVLVHAAPFLEMLAKAAKDNNLHIEKSLVKYYDETVFSGDFSGNAPIFHKQKKYDYQKEYRISFDTGIDGNDNKILSIGNLSNIAMRIDSDKINGTIKFSTVKNDNSKI